MFFFFNHIIEKTAYYTIAVYTFLSFNLPDMTDIVFDKIFFQVIKNK